MRPEWFGDGVACSASSAAGIQLAYNYVGAHGGGTVKLANGSYPVAGPINMNLNYVGLEGQGGAYSSSTRIVFTPTGQAQCAINMGAGAAVLSNNWLRHLTIATADTTTYKTAICVSDGSTIPIDDVFIRGFTGGLTGTVSGAANSGTGEIRLTVSGAASAGWNDGWAVAVSGVGGTTEANFGWPIVVSGSNTIDLKGSKFVNAYTSGGTITASSTGIRTLGRELDTVSASVSADLPLRISTNPNVAGGSEALDNSTFTNMTLAQAIGTNCVVMVDPNVVFTAVNFLGTQSWGGGKSKFCWRDNLAVGISEGLHIEHVKAEQASATGGFTFDIEPNNTLYNLHLNDVWLADTNGIFLRNVANWQLDVAHWLASTGVCLDINATVQNTQINGSFWLAGTSTEI